MAGAASARGARAAGLLLSGLATALAGCASFPPPMPEVAYHAPSPALPRAEDVQDASLGAREHPRLVAAFGGVYRMPRMEALLAEIVSELVPVSQRPDLRYQVTILNSPSINAFALPGGYLYVTRGLLALAGDKSELAAVLAHEMAHVTARHAAQREEKARTAALATRVLGEVIRNPEAASSPVATGQVSLAGFSRQQEHEADAIGLATVARAGYDAQGGVRFLVAMSRHATLETLDRNEGQDGKPDFLASHPSTPARIEKASAVAATLIHGGADRRTGRDLYLDALDGVVYGDDSQEGFIRGRRFIHAQLGFTFVAPEGFTLENSSRAVFGAGPGGEVLRFDGNTVPGEGPPINYVSEGWIEDAAVTDVQPLIVDGLPAATARGRVGPWQFRFAAIRVGESVYRFVLGSKDLDAATDMRFLETIRSFRRLDPFEAARVRPLRIRVATVGPGDTVNTLARRMATESGKLERFLVLNGLKPGERLRPGDKVKLIAE